MYKKFIYIFGIIALVFVPISLLGQTGETSPHESFIWLLMSVIAGISIVCIVLSFTILALIAKARKANVEVAEGAQQQVAHSEPVDLWAKIRQKLTAAVPVTREAEIDLGHEYDGIRELDNKLPPWWLYGFYFTIVIAIVYMFAYHVNSDWSSDQEYQIAMNEAQKVKDAYLARVANMVNEETVETLTGTSELKAGESIYMANCVACHGKLGEGGIGPNLTDEYWLHGGGIKNVFKTVKYGVPEKGMIPWQDQLKPLEMQQVSSYIMGMVGTNPPNGKAPQGEIWTPEVTEIDSMATISMIP